MKIVLLLSFLLVCFVEQSASKQCGTCTDWRWKDKVAVVTGASSGIGAEISVQLAELGVIVVGLARRETLIAELSKRTNGTIHAVKCDLLIEEQVVSIFRWIESSFGGVDILVNSAGTLIPGTLTTGNTTEWRNVMELNVLSLSVCTREALVTMRQRGDNGHIININSILGHKIHKVKNFYSGLFSPSKYAVTSITEMLTFELSELKSLIKVTSISPGLVATEFIDRVEASYGSTQISQPYLEPLDVAEAVIYVLSTRTNVQIAELTIQPIFPPLCENVTITNEVNNSF